jgi:hypothetical protein
MRSSVSRCCCACFRRASVKAADFSSFGQLLSLPFSARLVFLRESAKVLEMRLDLGGRRLNAALFRVVLEYRRPNKAAKLLAAGALATAPSSSAYTVRPKIVATGWRSPASLTTAGDPARIATANISTPVPVRVIRVPVKS